jgi:predicted RNA methylase
VTARRPPDFDLRGAIAAAGFTPRPGDVPGLVALLADDAAEADAERALLRLPGVAATLAELARAAAPPLRARLVRVLGRAAGEPGPLLSFLDDAAALGRHPAAAAALLARVSADRPLPELRAVVESLGKIAGPAALPALAALPGGDAELQRIAGRARLRIERTALRDDPAALADDVAPERPLRIRALCRSGLETWLAEELGGRVLGPGAVDAVLTGTLPTAFRARTMLRFGFALAGDPIDALASAEAFAILRRFTRGAIRYRIAFAAGHRRAEVMRIAAAVRARRPELVNDPKQSLWEVEVGDGEVLLCPKALADPRFTYRRRDVPASSHPTIAAALARAAGVRPDDVVWDPFCGAGTELVERALLGPVRALFGSDLSTGALDAATENLAAAGVTATLARADALAHRPRGVSLILTNPPLGRRVRADPDMFAAFVGHAAKVLEPGGRLVWISPFAGQTVAAARQSRLAVRLRREVDMGGFTAELQILTRDLLT